MIESLKLTLCLTRDCQLRCRYCYAGRKRQKSMSREMAEKAIDLALQEAQRTGRALDLGFFGGEPLLEWELLQHADAHLRARAGLLVAPPRFTLTTNGILLTEERAAWLAQRGYMVLLSIDGSQAMHNRNRVYPDGRGSYGEAARAAEIIRSTPGLMAQAVCVVSPDNVALLTEGIRHLSEIFGGIICLNFDYWARWSEEQLQVAEEQYGLLVAFMLDSFREQRPVIIDTFMGKMHALLSGGYRACEHCLPGTREICVSVEGNLFPCSRLVGDGDNADIIMGSVADGIDRAKQALYAAHAHRCAPACLGCAHRPYCIHWCGCSNYAGSGDFSTPSAASCRMEQVLIRLSRDLLTTLRRENNPVLREWFGHLPLSSAPL